MGAKVWLAGLVAVIIAVAGCTAPQQAPADALQASDASAAAGDGAKETSSGTNATGASGAAVNATNRTQLRVSTPFTFSGNTGLIACVFAAVAGPCVPVQDATSFLELSFTGNATRVSGTITWTASLPANAGMNAFLLHKVNDTYTWTQGDPAASGPSPLALDWDASPFAGAGLAIAFNNFQGAGAVAVFAGATTPQDFSVEGNVTSLA